jgi:hypothetical protein
MDDLNDADEWNGEAGGTPTHQSLPFLGSQFLFFYVCSFAMCVALHSMTINATNKYIHARNLMVLCSGGPL